MKKKIVVLLLVGAMAFCGCGSSESETGASADAESGNAINGVNVSTTAEVTTTEGIDVNLTGDYSEKAKDASYDEEAAVNISFSNDGAEVDGAGAVAEDGIVTISAGGTYVFRGTIEEGQIIVDVSEDENVQLVLSGVDISNSTAAPMLIISAKNVFLTIADGTENTIMDNRERTAESASTETSDGTETTGDADSTGTAYTINANAAIYSKCDLIINGTGSLTVEAGCNDGITSKDDLEIISGTITINAADDAIVGKDSVSVLDGSITLTAEGDGIKSSNTEDTAKGFVVIDGGNFTIDAGDDGIHSETVLVINGGIINVVNAIEGIESLNIVINDGVIDINSTDDGVNVSGGTDTLSEDVPVRGRGMDEAIDGALVINGGELTVSAEGDGLDSNGDILITGGTTTVYGPEDAGNGVIDYNGSMEITGGALYAIGTSGMEQTPSDNSTQSFVTANLSQYVDIGTEITILDSDGTELTVLTAEKKTNFVLVSMEQLTEGTSYTVKAGSDSVDVTAGEGLQSSDAAPGVRNAQGIQGTGGLQGMPKESSGTGSRKGVPDISGAVPEKKTE